MPNVLLKLHRFDDMESATQTADDIRSAGNVSYTDNSGSTVNVTVDDVTVENPSDKSAQASPESEEVKDKDESGA
jgi:hypothetical protein